MTKRHAKYVQKTYHSVQKRHASKRTRQAKFVTIFNNWQHPETPKQKAVVDLTRNSEKQENR